MFSYQGNVSVQQEEISIDGTATNQNEKAKFWCAERPCLKAIRWELIEEVILLLLSVYLWAPTHSYLGWGEG